MEELRTTWLEIPHFFTCGIQNETTILAWFIWRGEEKNTYQKKRVSVSKSEKCQENIRRERERDINKMSERKVAPFFSLTKLFWRWKEECCFSPCRYSVVCRLLLVSFFFYFTILFECYFWVFFVLCCICSCCCWEIFLCHFRWLQKYCEFFGISFFFFRSLYFFLHTQKKRFVLRPPCVCVISRGEKRTHIDIN